MGACHAPYAYKGACAFHRSLIQQRTHALASFPGFSLRTKHAYAHIVPRHQAPKLIWNRRHLSLALHKKIHVCVRSILWLHGQVTVCESDTLSSNSAQCSFFFSSYHILHLQFIGLYVHMHSQTSDLGCRSGCNYAQVTVWTA